MGVNGKNPKMCNILKTVDHIAKHENLGLAVLELHI